MYVCICELIYPVCRYIKMFMKVQCMLTEWQLGYLHIMVIILLLASDPQGHYGYTMLLMLLLTSESHMDTTPTLYILACNRFSDFVKTL